MSAETQYLRILQRIIDEGVVVKNERTGSNCLTVLNQRITFDGSEFPILTTRKVNWKSAINEMLCYIRGYTKLEDFHKLGVHSWDANAANWYEDISGFSITPENQQDFSGLNFSVGLIYGASANRVGVGYIDILEQIKNTPNDRGIIWNFWNPEYFTLGCLRPCMHTHQFNVLGNVLHLTSHQRSVDCPLGLVWNMIQCWFLLNITAHLTNLEVGTVTMNLVNCHIYENQLLGVVQQLQRKPKECKPFINGFITLSFDDVFNGSVTDKISLWDYYYHPSIKFPFTA